MTVTLEDHVWQRMGIPLAWLLAQDADPPLEALGDALGDSYLFRHNPVFANVRRATLALGYRFSAEDTPFWRDYQSLSLVALPAILSRQIIPYFDTGCTFRRLAAAWPNCRLPPGMIVSSVKRNYVLHESAHAIADSILGDIAGDFHESDARRLSILKAILAESFANATDAFGAFFSHKQIADTVFYSLNSYFARTPKTQETLTNAEQQLGGEQLFRLLLFSYFESNLASGDANDEAMERIFGTAQCAQDDKAAQAIVKVAFSLSHGFRESTTPAYFELQGYTTDYAAFAKSAWLSDGANQETARGVAKRFWEIVGAGGAVQADLRRLTSSNTEATKPNPARAPAPPQSRV